MPTGGIRVVSSKRRVRMNMRLANMLAVVEVREGGCCAGWRFV